MDVPACSRPGVRRVVVTGIARAGSGASHLGEVGIKVKLENSSVPLHDTRRSRIAQTYIGYPTVTVQKGELNQMGYQMG